LINIDHNDFEHGPSMVILDEVGKFWMRSAIIRCRSRLFHGYDLRPARHFFCMRLAWPSLEARMRIFSDIRKKKTRQDVRVLAVQLAGFHHLELLCIKSKHFLLVFVFVCEIDVKPLHV